VQKMGETFYLCAIGFFSPLCSCNTA